MIHYHGCPLSGGTASQLAFQGKHAMISFANLESHQLIIELVQSFCLDNGAFSAWKLGKPFDIEGFAEFVETWYRHPSFDFYVMPDVIDGDHNNNAQMRAHWRTLCHDGMWERGYPVWHLHEPLEVLRDLVHAFPGVALGSSEAYSEVGSSLWWQRMSEAMPIICDEQGRPKVKIHGLRMLDPTIFSHFPFSSSDSTNVARNMGTDSRWKGAYAPTSKQGRAMVMMDRIEHHASAQRWSDTRGVKQNHDLFG